MWNKYHFLHLFCYILQCYHWFPHEMMSQKWAPKIHTDDLSLPRSCSASHDWSYHKGNLLQPVRSTTQIWVVMCPQYGTFALFSQTSVVASWNVACFIRLNTCWFTKQCKGKQWGSSHAFSGIYMCIVNCWCISL